MKSIDRDTIVLSVGAVLLAVLIAYVAFPYIESWPALQDLF